MRLSTLDLAVLIFYFVAMIGVGIYVTRRASKNLDSYFLGGKTMPWWLLGISNDDTWVRYRPLFSDASAEPGNSYYYRTRAKNSAGSSTPSNVAGPIRVDGHYTVDELLDFSHSYVHHGDLALVTDNSRPYKEDPHRLKGNNGSWFTYRTLQPIHSA